MVGNAESIIRMGMNGVGRVKSLDHKERSKGRRKILEHANALEGLQEEWNVKAGADHTRSIVVGYHPTSTFHIPSFSVPIV